MKRRRNSARGSGNDMPMIRSIENGYWKGYGKGDGNAMPMILCTGNGYWNGSANAMPLTPSTGKGSWNGSLNGTPASGKSESHNRATCADPAQSATASAGWVVNLY